jgi:hypothetical protein
MNKLQNNKNKKKDQKYVTGYPNRRETLSASYLKLILSQRSLLPICPYSSYIRGSFFVPIQY